MIARPIDALALLEPRQLQLPQQVLVQRFAALVVEFLLALIVVAVPGRLAGRGGGLVPAVLDDLDASVVGLVGSGWPRFLAGFRRFALVRVRAEGLELRRGFGVVVGFEHDIGLEQFADMRLQFERWQLQQPDRLLQLRCHRQLLAQA